MEYISTTLGRHMPIIFNSHKLGWGVGGEHTVITVILENGKKGVLMKLQILPKLLQILHDNKHSHKWRMHRTYVGPPLCSWAPAPLPTHSLETCWKETKPHGCQQAVVRKPHTGKTLPSLPPEERSLLPAPCPLEGLSISALSFGCQPALHKGRKMRANYNT